MSIETIARMAHEANRNYCQSIGDHSQPPWGEAPAWQKESALNGVQFLRDNPDATAKESHESWLMEKDFDGWTYDTEKSVPNKTHPCMVPFDSLPIEHQIKDHIFCSVVRACIADGLLEQPDDHTPEDPGDTQADPLGLATEQFLRDVLEELGHARDEFPGNKHILAALTEEVGEVAEALLDNESLLNIEVDSRDVYEEAVQAACVAARLATEGDHSFPRYEASRYRIWGERSPLTGVNANWAVIDDLARKTLDERSPLERKRNDALTEYQANAVNEAKAKV